MFCIDAYISLGKLWMDERHVWEVRTSFARVPAASLGLGTHAQQIVFRISVESHL